MTITEKRVTLAELFDIFNEQRALDGKEKLSWGAFVHSIAVYFLDRPALDLRWHEIGKDEHKVYILPHTEIAKALAK